MAHNHEVARSKRVSGILLFASFPEARRRLLSDVKPVQTLIHRCGAEAARVAHNHEVARSKRVSGILLFVCFIVLPHNPPASSWGDQKLTVPLDVKQA